jgi:hypothetical protein
LTRSWSAPFWHVFGMIKLDADQGYAVQAWPLSLGPDASA